MPKTLNLNLTHKLSSDAELIYTSLLDFKKFGEIHEYIKEVKIIDDHSPEYIEYAILEEIYLFGFIKNYPKYKAKVYEIEKGKHIRYVSQVKKNIALIIDFNFIKSDKSSLTVEEFFSVTANPILGMIFLNILKKAHLKFFENLRKLLLTSIEDID